MKTGLGKEINYQSRMAHGWQASRNRSSWWRLFYVFVEYCLLLLQYRDSYLWQSMISGYKHCRIDTHVGGPPCQWAPYVWTIPKLVWNSSADIFTIDFIPKPVLTELVANCRRLPLGLFTLSKSPQTKGKICWPADLRMSRSRLRVRIVARREFA